jgi:hypothetical protein
LDNANEKPGITTTITWIHTGTKNPRQSAPGAW